MPVIQDPDRPIDPETYRIFTTQLREKLVEFAEAAERAGFPFELGMSREVTRKDNEDGTCEFFTKYGETFYVKIGVAVEPKPKS